MKTKLLVITTFAAACSLSPAAIPSKADLLRCDDNKNGSLENGELERLSDQARASALEAYDRNNDSDISASELAAGPERAKKDDDKDKNNKNKGGKKPNKKPNKKHNKKPGKK